MKSVVISLNQSEKVKQFVNIVSAYPYEIDLRSGKYVVDAKSILGIFSLTLDRPVFMEIYDDSCDDLLDAIKEFMVKS